MRYVQFTKKQFESTMLKISEAYHLAFPYDVTKEVEKTANMKIEEYVYALPTKNPSVKILIYSSVSRKTNAMRNNGSDAVRVVMKWTTKNGDRYKFLAKHLRIKTLFVNIRKTLVAANENIFSLNYKEFKELRRVWA